MVISSLVRSTAFNGSVIGNLIRMSCDIMHLSDLPRLHKLLYTITDVVVFNIVIKVYDFVDIFKHILHTREERLPYWGITVMMILL